MHIVFHSRKGDLVIREVADVSVVDKRMHEAVGFGALVIRNAIQAYNAGGSIKGLEYLNLSFNFGLAHYIN